MKLYKIAQAIEAFAPLHYQESYDNSGLLIGSPDKEITGVLTCVDVTEEVMDEARQKGCNMIVAHHPLIFGGLKRITGSSMVERIVQRAILEETAIYAVHTNLDNIAGGVNSILCRKLGISNCRALKPVTGSLRKLVTFCPIKHVEEVRQALFDAGAGHIGNYDSCSFNTSGSGTFRALEGSDPYTGQIGSLHSEPETRIETIFPVHIEKQLLRALFAAHPYEEVAFDIYPLENPDPRHGSGMAGDLAAPMPVLDFLGMVKEKLGIAMLRHTLPVSENISRVAVCGGSGAFLIPAARAAAAEAIITADIKYHDFFSHENQLLIIDAGHYETEQFVKELTGNLLKEKFPTFAVRISEVNTNPVHYL